MTLSLGVLQYGSRRAYLQISYHVKMVINWWDYYLLWYGARQDRAISKQSFLMIRNGGMDFGWHERKRWGFAERPVNIYEVHALALGRNPDGSPYSFAQLKDELISLPSWDRLYSYWVYAHDVPSLGLSWGVSAYGVCFALEREHVADQRSFKILSSVIPIMWGYCGLGTRSLYINDDALALLWWDSDFWIPRP